MRQVGRGASRGRYATVYFRGFFVCSYNFFPYLYETMSAQKQEGNKFDKILKENFEVVLPPFLERYFGLNIVEFEKLDTKLQTTIEKETDFIRIVTTAEGERFILHIEFQAKNETDMIYRIKEYDGIIQRKYQLEIRHYVIFLGAGNMTMRTRLHENEVFRGFEVLSLNELNYDDFLASQIPEEIIFAILCDFKGEQPEKIVRSIFTKLQAVSGHPNKLQKFVRQLQMLSQLCNLDDIVDKVRNDMPVLIDITQNALYKRGAREHALEIKREAIIDMLNDNFLPIDKIAQYLKVSIDDVIAIKNEIDEAAEAKRKTIINMLKSSVAIEEIAEKQEVAVDEVIAIKNELEQKEE